MKICLSILGLIAVAAARSATASTWYVKTNGNESAAGTNWATAKASIQAAIDVALSNDTVLVGNGVYATGGRVVYGAVTNRVAITNAIIVKSANGPDVTIIRGMSPNGNAAVRCVYVGTNAVLSGFTLTNGATRTSGDSFFDRSGGGAWCKASGILNNCKLTDNLASYGGGGVLGGTLNNCTLTGNSARNGGGAYTSTLNNCTLTGNSAGYNGGGAFYGTLNNCTLTGNSADGGGGTFGGTLNSCTLAGNRASNMGGGSWLGTLNNCTLTGNSAPGSGGAYEGILNNCIVYYNTAMAKANYGGNAIVNYSCTTPAPDGTGNITNEPKLASSSHLAAGSSCIGVGSSAYLSGTDLDGETWLNPPSMGCDELVPGSVTGLLGVSVWAAYTNVAAGFPVQFRADISGRPTASAWLWGDGLVSSNQPYVSHAYSSTGVYTVLLAAYNESYPLGVAATVTVEVMEQTIHYVNISNTTPVAPYTSWATAATNIQDAIDQTTQIGALALVSNGIYATGGRVVDGATTNRVAIDKPITVQSVNGPAVTIIVGRKDPISTNGNAAVRCVYVGINAVLSGFTLTNGATRTNGEYWLIGGGVLCESSGVLSNCTLTGNSAFRGGGGTVGGTLNNCTLSDNSAGALGGAVLGGTLNNCTLTGNSASTWGGGAYDSVLNNCTLSGNRSSYGGGVSGSALNNCMLSGNRAWALGGGAYKGTLNNCLLTQNSATAAGGAYTSALNNCTLTGNSADYNGGGAFYGTLNNCLLTGNSARNGGGAFRGALNNCTLTGNSASQYGGGAYTGTLNNCIVYYNAAPTGQNYYSSTFNYSSTTPAPSGTGNITNNPQFVDLEAGNFRLSDNSPCIDRGNNAYASGTADLDGHLRIAYGTVDMGAYEAQSPTGYWLWVGAITNGLTNMADSATGDCYPNLLKYATGSDPTNTDTLAAMKCSESDGVFRLLFNRNTNACDATLIAESSNAMSNDATWMGIATNSIGSWGGATNVVETGTNPASVTVQDMAGDTTNLYMRLRVTRP